LLPAFLSKNGNAKLEMRNSKREKFSWPLVVRRLVLALVPEWESTQVPTPVRCGAGDGRHVVRAYRRVFSGA